MQQIHAEGSVRHAEKRRSGTCQFSNRIARISLDAYKCSVPQSYRDANNQTCIAAIVAHFPPGSTIQKTDKYGCNDGGVNHNSHLQVMGLGVGTKFLPDATIREEQQLGASDDESYGKRVRDCHAEVLARRAFRRQISLEILSDLQSKNNKQEGGEGDSRVTGYDPILERIDDQKDIENLSVASSSIRYRLRKDVTLHFYASSAPCK